MTSLRNTGIRVNIGSIESLLTRVSDERQIVQGVRAFFEDRLAPEFNIFNFIRPDELRLSEILAWLLAPKASHGQGDKFLRNFIDMFAAGWSPERLNDTTVSLEKRADVFGRIDLLICFRDRSAIAIENKAFDAPHQHRQLQRYFDYLDQICGDSRKRILCLSSSYINNEPPDNSISKDALDRRRKAGEFEGISCADLLPWIEWCRGSCRAATVGMFLEFSYYIRRQFMGEKDLMERERVVEVITRTPESVESAIQIRLAWDGTRRHLLDKLRSDLQDRAGDLWEVTWRINPDRLDDRYSSIQIRSCEGDSAKILLEFQNTGLNGLIFGVPAPDGSTPNPPQKLDAARSGLGIGKSSRGWLWYRAPSKDDPILPIEQHWGSAEGVWVEIAEGKLAEKIIEAAQMTATALRAGALS